MTGRRLFCFAVYLFFCAAGIIIFCQAYIVLPFASRITSSGMIFNPKYIVVFGGGMKNSTEQSDMQADRVRLGAELWHRFPSSTLFFTGDDGARHGDEITAMESLAGELGVSTSSMQADPHGYRTILSCGRLKEVYGISEAVVVSQKFHLYRILFLCNYFGLSVQGVSADMRHYDRGWITAGPREWGARVRAVGEIFFLFVDRAYSSW